MPEWNPRSPRDWARRLGFISVPLFGPDRAAHIGNPHAVLLDGSRGSLTFSVGNSEVLIGSPLLQWAWSANVGHSIIADDRRDELFILQWDRGSTPRRESLPDVSEAERIIRTLYDDEPPEGESSIERAVDIFRGLRAEIIDEGGNDADSSRAFNVLLLWATVRIAGGPELQSLPEVLDSLREQGVLTYAVHDFSPPIRKLRLGALVEELLYRDGGYSLDADLLLRHASGTLFQEAHIELGYRPQERQRKLFVTLRSGLPKPIGHLKRDAHYTPAPLARFLAESAIREFRRLNPDASSVTILDPACGSGVFLIEALRELGTDFHSVVIRGIDESDISCVMADFAVRLAAREFLAQGVSVQVDIMRGDSLASESWGQPDIVLMNPPFLPWRSIKSSTRDAIRNSLGDMYAGQSDTAVAFISKATSELQPGAVFAAVSPAALLQSRAALPFRSLISTEDQLSLALVGRFRGYGYFTNATVEPAFMLISRQLDGSVPPPVRSIFAEDQVADWSIRAARRTGAGKSNSGEGWEVIDRPQLALRPDDWTPRPSRAEALLSTLVASGHKSVTELFDVMLGIRTGRNPVFLVSAADFESLNMSESERAFFRPLADHIRNGRIRPDGYVFYPYDARGQVRFRTEDELYSAVPAFYSARLLPNRESLESRRSLRTRQWWELVEPRPTWVPKNQPKLVSTTFGRRGSFAYDTSGLYALVQGHAWIWKMGEFDNADLPFAYVALLNSPVFEGILDYFCPRQQGRQYELADRFLQRVPLPNLRKCSAKIMRRLAVIGRDITAGLRVSLITLDASVASAYGVTPHDLEMAFPLTVESQLEKDFQRLASEWKKASEFQSSMGKMIQHPAYREILSMGQSVVPLIIADLRIRPQRWFHALQTLTGCDPVSETERGDLARSADAWIRWAEQNGIGE